jgi:hypothetical protein
VPPPSWASDSRAPSRGEWAHALAWEKGGGGWKGGDGEKLEGGLGHMPWGGGVGRVEAHACGL